MSQHDHLGHQVSHPIYIRRTNFAIEVTWKTQIVFKVYRIVVQIAQTHAIFHHQNA
jgi:hypothetical protein